MKLPHMFPNNQQIRQISYNKIRTWYANLVKPSPSDPPYNHIIQIGDPTLRNIAEKVPNELVTSPEVQFLIKRMKSVFVKYDCVGLSANQIGFPVQIFIAEFSKKHMKDYTKDEQRNREMSLLPLTIVINPELKVTDYTTVKFPEMCASVRGMSAEVPRYRAVQVNGLNEDGEEISTKFIGWNARIVQHEIDHLNGKIFTDIMDRKTLSCTCWHIINERKGRVHLPYGPD